MSNPNNSFIGSLGLGVAYKINKNFTADISTRYSVLSGKYVFDNSVGKMKIGLDRASNFMYSFGL